MTESAEDITRDELGDHAHLGRGWAFPLRWFGTPQDRASRPLGFERAGSGVMLVEREEDIRQSIRIILGTRVGERVMHPDFGSHLHEYVFQPLSPTTLNLVSEEVRRALLLWERRIADIRVKARVAEDEIGRIDVEISYRVDTHRLRQNFVYPFYVSQPEGE